VKKKKIKGEPIDLKQTCLDMNCVGAEGGWRNMHWNEENIQTLVTWPLIKHLWEKTEGNNPRKFSDIARLAVLWEYGGAYLDSDMACYKPFDMLLESPSLLGATMIGGQAAAEGSEHGLFINGIAFVTARHPFMEWLLLAFQRRSLKGADWVTTGPLVWGQEFESFSKISPDLARDIKILPSLVFCPLSIRGDIPPDFSMDPVWTINYYPGTTKVSYKELFDEFLSSAAFPRCEDLETSKRIHETLSGEHQSHIEMNRPSAEVFVPMAKLKKET
jgi:hypothetical protein